MFCLLSMNLRLGIRSWTASVGAFDLPIILLLFCPLMPLHHVGPKKNSGRPSLCDSLV
jgi:hypothetical protein